MRRKAIVCVVGVVLVGCDSGTGGTSEGSDGGTAPDTSSADAVTGAGDVVQGADTRASQVVLTTGERGGLVLSDEGYGDGATKLVYLEQGWSGEAAEWFYHTDQGSVLLPYDVLVNLETADGSRRFVAPENLTKYRFLNQVSTPENPDALPVGFARHEDKVGLTCAACHSTQVNYKGTAMRVDGAPSLANIPSFFTDLDTAVGATLADEAKLSRFAATWPGPGDAASKRDAAKSALESTHAWFTSYLEANRSTTVEGFGRLDAVGRIINQVIRFTSDPKNSLEPNAPTSFPLLWDAPRHDFVQWTGFAGNADIGPLARNAGEVVGVFADVKVVHYETSAEAKKGYENTVAADNLAAMEASLWGLQSPVWPETILPAIDRELAAKGKPLYDDACASCHAPIDRADPDRRVTAIMTHVDSVKTDKTSAWNVVHARAPTGILEGAISPSGETYGAEAGAFDLLGDVVVRVLSTRATAVAKTVLDGKKHGLTATEKQGDYARPTEADPKADLYAYKARPLNGIWAAAPYLHNGSVPTLYHLLLPAAERPATFTVGRLEFDPEHVGFVHDGTVPFVYDTSVVGNSNAGHEYGTALSEADRLALLEYLKTL